MKRSLLSMLIAMLVFSRAALAVPGDSDLGEAYVQPTFRELTQTLVLMGGFDITKPDVLGEYAKLAYCDLYLEKFKSDFEWNNVKRGITSRILEKKEMYRIRYEIRGIIKLDRYDFEGQFFPLEKKSKLNNVGSMLLFEGKDFEPYCPAAEPTALFPRLFYLQLAQPLNLDAINIPLDDAEKLLQKLDELKIADRSLYARFRFKILEVSQLTKSDIFDATVRADFLGKITQIDFFYDQEMTKWVASVPFSALK